MTIKYLNYLKSEKWNKINKWIHIRDKVCQNCGSNKKIQVHHTTYKNIYNELNHLEDVKLLCNKCHYLAHNLWLRVVYRVIGTILSIGIIGAIWWASTK